jgi:hypothetical protein
MVRIATFNANNLFSRWSFATELPRTLADTALPALHVDTAAPTTSSAGTTAAPVPAEDVVRVVLPDGTELTGVLRTFRGHLVRGKDPKDRAFGLYDQIWTSPDLPPRRRLRDLRRRVPESAAADGR